MAPVGISEDFKPDASRWIRSASQLVDLSTVLTSSYTDGGFSLGAFDLRFRFRFKINWNQEGKTLILSGIKHSSSEEQLDMWKKSKIKFEHWLSVEWKWHYFDYNFQKITKQKRPNKVKDCTKEHIQLTFYISILITAFKSLTQSIGQPQL